MICTFVQRTNELFGASFELIGNCGERLGQASFKGHLGSREGIWDVRYGSTALQMQPAGFGNGPSDQKAFRAYAIQGGSNSGMIFRTESNGSIFRRYSYHHMDFRGSSCDAYVIGFGKEGCKTPVYVNNRQMALIEKENVVVDELNVYRISAVDAAAGQIAMLFCCYMYLLGCYRAGEKAIKSTKTVYHRTTNAELLSKYDPNFRVELK